MKGVLSVFIIVLCVLSYATLKSHELFSIRADVARQGGVNVDALLKFSKAGGQRELEYLNRIMYGFTEYLTGELRVPIFLEKKVSELRKADQIRVFSKTAGLGKCEVIGKIRMFHDYALGKRNQIVAVCGLLLPTARRTLTNVDGKPIINNNSMDFLIGATGAFETLTFYHFTSLTYRINTSARRIREGNQFSYSYAFGYRPEKPDIKKVDWVFLIDVDGTWTEKTVVKGSRLHDSGSNVIFVGPSFFRSKGNLMIKGGIQVPFIQHLNGNQEKNDVRVVLGAFIQF